MQLRKLSMITKKWMWDRGCISKGIEIKGTRANSISKSAYGELRNSISEEIPLANIFSDCLP